MRRTENHKYLKGRAKGGWEDPGLRRVIGGGEKKRVGDGGKTLGGGKLYRGLEGEGI